MPKDRKKPAEGNLTDEMLRERAYHIWEREGRPHGRDLDHWLEAQAMELAERGKKPAKRTAARKTAKKAVKKATAESPKKKTSKKKSAAGAKRTAKTS